MAAATWGPRHAAFPIRCKKNPRLTVVQVENGVEMGFPFQLSVVIMSAVRRMGAFKGLHAGTAASTTRGARLSQGGTSSQPDTFTPLRLVCDSGRLNEAPTKAGRRARCASGDGLGGGNETCPRLLCPWPVPVMGLKCGQEDTIDQGAMRCGCGGTLLRPEKVGTYPLGRVGGRGPLA